MGESITTRLDEPYARQPETLAAAARYLTRTGNADVLEILGLADPTPEPVDPGTCGICNNPLPKLGICRRSQLCREKAPALSEAKRRAARP